jgi:hypothetical protein
VRYATEVQALIEESGGSPRKVIDLSRTALDAWSQELSMRSVIGRWVRLVLKAYLVALAVMSTGALLLLGVKTAGRLFAGVPLSTSYLFGRHLGLTIAAIPIYPAVVMAYSLVVSVPVYLAWRTTGLWRKWHWAARITFVLAFIVFGLWLRRPPDIIIGAAAGWVLAVGLFPRASASAGSDSTRHRSDSGLDLAPGAAAEEGTR